MAEKKSRATPAQKLEVAQWLVSAFQDECEAKRIIPDPEILVMAVYAVTDASWRQALFVNGLK